MILYETIYAGHACDKTLIVELNPLFQCTTGNINDYFYNFFKDQIQALFAMKKN